MRSLAGFHASRSNASLQNTPPYSFAYRQPRVYAEALILARALRSSNRCCFLSRRTLKRSKSVRPLRLAIWSRFFAQLLSFHLASTSDFSQYFFRVACRAPRGRPSMTVADRRVLARGTDCRGTTSSGSEEVPSTRTWFLGQPPLLPRPLRASLPWSTYSLVVDDLDNGGEAAGEGVVAVDDNNAANLNEAPVGTLDHCFAHFDYWSVGRLVSRRFGRRA